MDYQFQLIVDIIDEVYLSFLKSITILPIHSFLYTVKTCTKEKLIESSDILLHILPSIYLSLCNTFEGNNVVHVIVDTQYAG